MTTETNKLTVLDFVKFYAMEKYAGDVTKVNEFMEGFEKEAGFMSSPIGVSTSGASAVPTVAHGLKKGLSESLGKGLGTLFIGAGATGLGSIYGSVQNGALHSKFLRALENAYNANRLLRETEKTRVLAYAETIFKFAPNVATDSNLLSSILANAIQGEGIDVTTIKTLTELEGRYKDNSSFSPKTYV